MFLTIGVFLLAVVVLFQTEEDVMIVAVEMLRSQQWKIYCMFMTNVSYVPDRNRCHVPDSGKCFDSNRIRCYVHDSGGC